jgi:hypothetical protein
MKKVNRYSGEIRINPIAILRNDDFNNDGRIHDIQEVLGQVLELNNTISQRVEKIRERIATASGAQFFFAEGGYIGMRGFSDDQLLEMHAAELIDLFDFATDRDWVKKYGAQFGLVWENGRAVEM